MLTGGLSVAVLGATIWSLQPHRRAGEQTELYNVDRVSKSEGLDGLPSDYSKLPKGMHGARKLKRQQLPRCSSARARLARPPRQRLRKSLRLAKHRPWRASTRWPPGQPRRRLSLPTRPLCKTGKTKKRRS